MSTPEWNEQQLRAIEQVTAWLRNPNAPQIFRLFGFAGTGKTTLAKYLASLQHGRVLFAAFTGKAASVLREKGCGNATTLHSLLYNVEQHDRLTYHKLLSELGALDPNDPYRAEMSAMVAAEEARLRKPKWTLSEESDVSSCNLLVLDEVSMVDKRLAKDAMSFGKKILVLGDPAQLPPVKGLGYFTDAKPDVMLTHIHRQAEDNPILRWATLVRNGGIIPFGQEGTARKVKRDRIDDRWLASQGGQILCGKNLTRDLLNRRVRKQLGFKSPLPEHNDVLVVLRNNHKLGIMNGVICNAHKNAVSPLDGWPKHVMGMHLRYEDKMLYDQLVDTGPFLGVAPNAFDDYLVQVDFGYAITVHKSQGSEWNAVTLWDDSFAKMDADLRKRWLYTAITRARHSLTIVAS